MKTKNFSLFACIALFGLLFIMVACNTESKSPEEKAAEAMEKTMQDLEKNMEKTGKNVENNLEDAMSNLEKTMENLKGEHKIKDPISFREFKPVVKETFAGLPQTDLEGSNAGTMGFDVSTLKAEFKEGDKSVRLEIFDTGGLGMAAMGMAAWTMAKIDKESKNGYERTTTFEGHKAYEKCEGKRCELTVFVENRIIYKVEATNVDMDDITDGAKDDVDELESIIKKNS